MRWQEARAGASNTRPTPEMPTLRDAGLRAVAILLIVGALVSLEDWPAVGAVGVRTCLYVPGASVPARLPEPRSPSRPQPVATAFRATASQVDPSTTARQLRVHGSLRQAVDDHYVYPDFRGRDWKAIGARYEALIRQGLRDVDFYAAMQAMLSELGDEHSYYQSPAQVREEETRLAQGAQFVGIGALLQRLPDGDHAVVLTVFPDSPAAQAGLRRHDTILRVDGGPVQDAFGQSRTRGPEGTSVRLTVRRPGEPAREVTVTRRRVAGALPIDSCRIANRRIAYIFWPTFLERTIPSQTREALRHLASDGPLEGLVLDNRMNGGGLGSVAEGVAGLFTHGVHGHWVSRTGREPFRLQAEDVGGSQKVPLVVLAGVNTVSFGEIVSGVLRLAGRARIVGGPTRGNVERLREYKFEDGSRAWVASEAFQPLGQAAGVWEGTGLRPDVVLPTRWDQFTEANDPALAKAVELLSRRP